ncbi:hypothetical protein DL769_002551 [Monosporascus sp. CRB-8-3]|nr:hypothetical protein DL769_002551 [Monosporascus sp. CRB-8-3]
MHLGLPSLVTSDMDLATIRTILNDYAPSNEFAAQVRVQLAVANFANVLSNNSNDEIDSSLVRMLDSELDTLKTTCADGWSDIAELSVLVAKLHFYALVITRLRPGATSRDILLRLGLGVSLRIAYLANARLHDNPIETNNLTLQQRQRIPPKNYFRGLAFATVFLLRYFSLNSAVHADEQQLAANHVMMAHHIFQTCAASPRDEFGRAAVLFETLARQAPISADATKLRLTDRMGVSILLDAVSTASEVRGRPVEIAEHESPGGTSIYHKQESYIVNGELPAGGASEPWLAELILSNNNLWDDTVWDIFNYQAGFPQAALHPLEMHPHQ